jgi:hypothetical protein
MKKIFLGIMMTSLLVGLMAGCGKWDEVTAPTGTLDTTAPTVASTVPADNAVGVALNGNITAIFGEAMNSQTITATTFTLRHGSTTDTGSVTYSGVSAVFNPASNLLASTTYTATITTGAKDLAGNALLANYVWTFTTGAAADAVRPTVISTAPLDEATGVAININPTATFSEAMDPSRTSAFTLQHGSTFVTGVVTYVGATATFTAPDLLPSTLYTATITTGARDLADNTLLANYVWTFTTGASAGQLTVPLGTASRFAILSHSAITDIPTSSITGDVGLSPGVRSAITGLLDGDGQVVAGYAIYAADDAGPVPAMLIAAKADAEIAFDSARDAVRGTLASISGNLNGLTLTPGLYESGTSIEISPAGFLYLDAGGDANAVFIIRSATTITTESTSEVVLQGNAQAENIFWTAGSAITLGVNSKMKGTLIAGTSISLQTGARLDGRALIQGSAAGQVSLDQNIIVKP